MKSLLKMQFKLNFSLPLWLFPLFGAFVLIPDYPIIVGAGYIIVEAITFFRILLANRSTEFALTLPVKKRDVSSSVCMVLVITQIASLLISAICAPFAKMMFPGGNIVGIDPNLAYFGIAFICLGAFNLIFFAKTFKTGYKFGLPALFGTIVFLLVYAVFECAVQAVPAVRSVLDGYALSGILYRAIFCVSGAVIYALLTLSGIKKAGDNFEKADY